MAAIRRVSSRVMTAPGRILRRIDDDQFGPVRDFRFQIVGVKAETVFFIDRDPHVANSQIAGDGKIGWKAGVRENNFVSGVDQATHHEIDDAIGRQYDDLIQIGAEAPATFDIASDRLDAAVRCRGS